MNPLNPQWRDTLRRDLALLASDDAVTDLAAKHPYVDADEEAWLSIVDYYTDELLDSPMFAANFSSDELRAIRTCRDALRVVDTKDRPTIRAVAQIALDAVPP